MNVLSDPLVRLVQPRFSCKRCDEVSNQITFITVNLSRHDASALFYSERHNRLQEGHTKRSCSIAKAEANPDQISEDDLLFWSLVKQEDRPTVLHDANDDDDNDDDNGDEVEGDTSESESDGD